MSAESFIAELLAMTDTESLLSKNSFRTGKRQYSDNEIFLGIKISQIRITVKAYSDMPLREIEILLTSCYHDAKLAGFIMLVEQFKKTNDAVERRKIYSFYLKHLSQAHNCDLVDISCKDIVGGYLLDKDDRSILYVLAHSPVVCKQRISIVSTWTFIKHLEFDDTLNIAKILLPNKHAPVQKAVGWMLREVGKKDRNTLILFLEKYSSMMPCTALQYAIKHFSPEEQRKYMNNR
ncbi:MAG: DNA alkylation repair protein [Prevotellaceae bacterium]|jgi:3-methyladenine DNA glycosylase AlkD|nr:DNA alkylation repair protein [Prevotellaceae bacterium]